MIPALLQSGLSKEIPSTNKKMIEYKVIVLGNGDKLWYLNGSLHREDGPAKESADGTKWWYLNGKCHREDGPAIEHPSGSKYWFLNGKYHREDGPALEYADGYKAWYLNGKQLTEREHQAQTQGCTNKVIEIDGKKYKLVEA